MTDPTFVLTERPWLPCETLEGTPRELSLRDALVEAHSLRALVGSSPPMTAALHRLLLAVLHRCFGPADEASWIALWEKGRFDTAVVDGYLRAWGHRFDLFHPERPFYQVRGLPDYDDALTGVVIERSSWGPGVNLFEHRPEVWDESMEPSEAARWLVTHHAYAIGGLVKKPGEPVSASGGPLMRGVVTLLTGGTLFETLLLNLLMYAGDRPIPAEGDAPAWEQDPLPQKIGPEGEPRRMPRGWLDLLTWQSRRLELKVRDNRVTGWIRRVGQGVSEGAPRDPMLTWRTHEKYGLLPLQFQPERALWRDSEALFRGTTDRGVIRPAAVEQVSRSAIADRVGSERRFSLTLLGLSAEKASIHLVRAEHIPVSAGLLADPDLGETVHEALGLVDQTGSALRSAAFVLARWALGTGERSPATEDVSTFMRKLGATERYWSSLQHPFERFIAGVEADWRGARDAFVETAISAAREALRAAAGAVGTTARALKATSEAERNLGRGLADVRAAIAPKAITEEGP